MKRRNAHTGVSGKGPGHNRPPTTNIDSMWRTHSATVALLKHAYSLITKAESRIAAQDARIAQLEKLAMTDELTGLYNRRGFDMHFSRELDRAERHDNKGGLLILFDLDHFKEINDVYGHPAGDACLEMFGTTLAQEIRKVDVAARLGGDEFAILLTQTDPAPALQRARTLLLKMNALTLNWCGRTISLATSMGAEMYSAGDNPAKIYAAADRALYNNKRPSINVLLDGLKNYTPGTPAPL